MSNDPGYPDDDEEADNLCHHCDQPFDNTPKQSQFGGFWTPTICPACFKDGWKESKTQGVYQVQDKTAALFKQKPAAKPGARQEPTRPHKINRVSISRTFNTGNYESIKLEVGSESDFELWQDLYNQCLAQLNKEAESLSLSPTGMTKTEE